MINLHFNSYELKFHNAMHNEVDSALGRALHNPFGLGSYKNNIFFTGGGCEGLYLEPIKTYNNNYL